MSSDARHCVIDVIEENSKTSQTTDGHLPDNRRGEAVFYFRRAIHFYFIDDGVSKDSNGSS
jgi:hypothetical protein